MTASRSEILLLGLPIALIVIPGIVGQPAAVAIEGTITNVDGGKGIEGVHAVVLSPQAGNGKQPSDLSDRDGTYSIPVEASGKYTVEYAGEGWMVLVPASTDDTVSWTIDDKPDPKEDVQMMSAPELDMSPELLAPKVAECIWKQVEGRAAEERAKELELWWNHLTLLGMPVRGKYGVATWIQGRVPEEQRATRLGAIPSLDAYLRTPLAKIESLERRFEALTTKHAGFPEVSWLPAENTVALRFENQETEDLPAALAADVAAGTLARQLRNPDSNQALLETFERKMLDSRLLKELKGFDPKKLEFKQR